MPNGRFAFDTGYFQLDSVDVWPLKALRHGEDGPNGVYRLAALGSRATASEVPTIGSTCCSTSTTTAQPRSSITRPDGLESVHAGTTVSAQFSEAMDAARSCSSCERGQPARCRDHQLRQPESAGDLRSRRRACTPRHLHGQGRRCEGQVRCSDRRSLHLDLHDHRCSWHGADQPLGHLRHSGDSHRRRLARRARRPVPQHTGGTITGLRFYKAPTSAGPHVGHLWSAAGALLATVTFDDETSSGWQQKNLPNRSRSLRERSTSPPTMPRMGAGPVGGFFASGPVKRGPLQTTADTQGNGVYRYGATGGFPSSASNGGQLLGRRRFKDQGGPTTVDLDPAPGLVSVAPTRPSGPPSTSRCSPDDRVRTARWRGGGSFVIHLRRRHP